MWLRRYRRFRSRPRRFGSLPGSQGGEFVFTEPEETEYLTASTQQLSSEAIAMNGRVDAVATSADEQPVTIKDLQGGERRIVLPPCQHRQGFGPAAGAARQRSRPAAYKEKRYDEAEAQFTEALKLRPDFALAANNLGFIYYRQNKYAEAARWLEKHDQDRPFARGGAPDLGDARNLGQKAKAKAAYQAYLELQPNAVPRLCQGTTEAALRQRFDGGCFERLRCHAPGTHRNLRFAPRAAPPPVFGHPLPVNGERGLIVAIAITNKDHGVPNEASFSPFTGRRWLKSRPRT